MENRARITIAFTSFFCLYLLCAPYARAQEAASRTYPLKDGSSLTYSEPAFWRALGDTPSDIAGFTVSSFKKENLPWVAAVTASTVLLIHYDQTIFDGAKKLGKRLNISSKDKTKPYLTLGGVQVFRGPADLGSGLYFIGDGWVTIGFFGYFKTAGWLGHDWRASQTGNQLAEGLIATGLVTEAMKNVFGRETPERSSGKGGVWRMFPGLPEYAKRRPRYDAFPSGHLATTAMAVTVMAENYPDNKYIVPVGYTLMGALCFQMINNGVHWAGDYPLGFAVGYGLGKAIASQGRGAARRSAPAGKSALNFAPYVGPQGEPGAMLAYAF